MNTTDAQVVPEAAVRKPLSRKQKRAIGWSVVVVLVAWWLFVPHDSSTADGVLKMNLRSPSTYSSVSHDIVWSGKDKDGHSAVIVKVTYDSLNGFGATVRDCQYVAFWYRSYFSYRYYPNRDTWPCSEQQSVALEALRSANGFVEVRAKQADSPAPSVPRAEASPVDARSAKALIQATLPKTSTISEDSYSSVWSGKTQEGFEARVLMVEYTETHEGGSSGDCEYVAFFYKDGKYVADPQSAFFDCRLYNGGDVVGRMKEKGHFTDGTMAQ